MENNHVIQNADDIEVEFMSPADYYTDTHAMNDIHRLLKSNPDDMEEIYKIINKTGRKIEYKKNTSKNFSINSGIMQSLPSHGFKAFSGTGNKLGSS